LPYTSLRCPFVEAAATFFELDPQQYLADRGGVENIEQRLRPRKPDTRSRIYRGVSRKPCWLPLMVP
jgi:hypothetical protein